MNDLRLNVTGGTGLLREEDIRRVMEESASVLEQAKQGEAIYRDSLGWLDVDRWAGGQWLDRCRELARKVQADGDVLVVVGIGGSNQAARAVVDAIGQRSGVQILWAGNSISAHSICQVLAQLEGRSVYVNVIAKNFETLEPGIGFRALRAYLRERYGEAYKSRIICTGTQGSHLELLSRQHGFRFLPFPKDIGGRFSALSSVGLFPMAAAGMDVTAMVEGAREIQMRLQREGAEENIALRYAAIRRLLYQKGFRMEMLSFFEPRLFRFSKWWVQLFGESEGKDGFGLYPLAGNFSEDLHSVGQFLQCGTPVIFETFLEVRDSGASYILQADDVADRFDYLNGKDFDEINRIACEATVQAHGERYPCIRLSVPKIDERTFGMLFYFFFFACYLSAKLLGVNPFDQPGVEAYKRNMFQALGK